MLSSTAALSAVLLLPAVFAQNASSVNSSATPTTSTSESGTGTTFTPPTVSGTSCGTAQQNFNQCVTKVSKDISNCPSTGYVCLCQTYANLAACYNACPDLSDGSTWKGQASQYCSQANISDTGSVYNTTSPVTPTVNTSTTTTNTTSSTPTTSGRTNTSTTTSPLATASAFARNSANRNLDLSFGLVAIAAGLGAFLFA
ncbi:hypothetical protein CROQUDRAFT_654517 [Cronartium quercuum f. sp. fusiforme G11]|uniref:Uncharacterized protein n=1 Tax=Cronartium quercuum f. sp. fusiforme G11 TaxID=708437 RepID=A0A9P6TDQ7_9BASI|nr:hypothetical protein CROQUDRAFT_654517 [Cronartium quercuum f. sp. fusiforme G11]